MRKSLALSLAIVMLLALFSACASQKQEVKEETAQMTEETAAVNEADKATEKQENSEDNNTESADTNNAGDKTLTVWGPLETVYGDNLPTNEFTKIYEEKTGVKVDWRVFDSSEDQTANFNLSLASGEFPDIYARSFSPEEVLMCVEADVLLPLNDLIEGKDTAYKKALADSPSFKDYVTAPDGNIYTFFSTDVGYHVQNSNKMYVNKKWMENYLTATGKTDVVTVTDFQEMLTYFRDNDMNGNGDAKDEIPLLGSTRKDSETSNPMPFLMSSFELFSTSDITTTTYYYFTDDGKPYFFPVTDGFREGLKYLNGLVNEDLLYRDTYVIDNAQMKSMLQKAEGEQIVGAYSYWFGDLVLDYNVMAMDAYVPLAPLANAKGENRQIAANRDPMFFLTSAITKSCKDPQVAYDWLDYFLSDEGSFASFYGFREGVDYKYDDSRASLYGVKPAVIKILDAYKDNFRWGLRMPFQDGEKIRFALYESRGMDYSTDSDAITKYRPFFKYTNMPQIVWQTDPDLSSEKVEMELAFKTFINSKTTDFILGNEDINDDKAWQDYLKELDDMGLEDFKKVISEYYGK